MKELVLVKGEERVKLCRLWRREDKYMDRKKTKVMSYFIQNSKSSHTSALTSSCLQSLTQIFGHSQSIPYPWLNVVTTPERHTQDEDVPLTNKDDRVPADAS